VSLGVKEIREEGRKIVLANPGGIRYAEIVAKIQLDFPTTNPLTIQAQIANSLVQSFPTELTKPSRGLYVPLLNGVAPLPSIVPPPTAYTEQHFYEPFATYLQNDLEEATSAAELGGASLKTKWGTPDVVGVYRPVTSDLVKFAPEIVAAEIKIDANQPVVAFGQAVAYRLFASRSYVVMPSTMTARDQSQLEALCMLFGIGFVLFDPQNPKAPSWQIRVRAQGHAPDVFYVNEFARRLHESQPATFHKLFS
jgi:hypothetical protein